MKAKLLVLSLILLVCLKASTSLANDSTLISYVNQNKQDPTDYLMGKLRDNDVILLGERHNQGHQLEMVNSFIQRLSKIHRSTILALEISTDEQNRVDYFLETGTGLEEIKFSSHLSSTLYKDLLITARESGVKVLAIDMPPRVFKHTKITRDEYMANTLIAEIEETNKVCKIFALVGSIHTIKAPIEWLTADNSYKYLGLLLNKKNPKLKVSSIYQEINKPDSDIDKSLSNFEECIACNIGEPFSLYKGSSLRLLNCKPINIPQAFDGVIYHH